MSKPSGIWSFECPSPHQRDIWSRMRRQTGSESAISSSRSTGALRGGGLIRQCFLIVQCKSVSFETQDAVWAEAEEQLEEYLAATHKRTRPANRTPVYGAVAVGRRIGFYKYNHNSKEMCANTMIPDTSSLPWCIFTNITRGSFFGQGHSFHFHLGGAVCPYSVRKELFSAKKRPSLGLGFIWTCLIILPQQDTTGL